MKKTEFFNVNPRDFSEVRGVVTVLNHDRETTVQRRQLGNQFGDVHLASLRVISSSRASLPRISLTTYASSRASRLDPI